MSSGGRIAGGSLITGSGGGGGKSGGKPYNSTTARDGLDSRQYAQIIDLIGEGEIKGLVDGHKSILLNGTPLQNADGSYNFSNFSFYANNGTQNQAALPISNQVENEVPVNTPVLYGLPVVRTVTSPAVDAARITISIPQLQQITDKGDLTGTSIQLQIAVQYRGGGYTTVVDDTITGRTGDLYQRDYVLNFSGSLPVDIRITRLTQDSADPRLTNAFSWSSLTELTYARLRYPNSAVFGWSIDAEQFNSIPSRQYLIDGKLIKIPSNATVDQSNGRLIYSGVWDGTFGAAQWCACPAWVLYNFLTSTRYGFGDHITPASLDKWSFYAASVYSNQLVDDGVGGQEARFSCNVNIQTAEDAYKLVNDLCSVFRAMPYWGNGSLTISQDRPSDPAYLLTTANTGEGPGTTYQSSSRKTRPTVAVGSFLDMETREIAKEVVQDTAAIARWGVVKAEINAFGCTSRGQAARLGRWLIYEEQNGEVASTPVGPETGAVVRPGMVVAHADPLKAGARRGGRIVSATTSAITVDDATGLVATNSPTLSVILFDGSVQLRPVASVAGNVITVSPSFSTAPLANSVWVFESTDLLASTWRVLGIEEGDDGVSYTTSMISHNPGKYPYIENGTPLPPRDTTNLNELPAAPTDLNGQEVLYNSNGTAKAKIILSWKGAQGVSTYRVRWRQQTGNWNESRTEATDFEILDTTEDIYEIKVFSAKAELLYSATPASLRIAAYGKTAPPSDVTGLSLIPIDSASAILSWDQAPDLDVRLGGKVLIRHSTVMVGATWENSQELVPNAAGSQTQKQIPLLTGTVLVKFEDDSGNRSITANTVVTTLPEPQPRLSVTVYAEDAESPPFNGNTDGMIYMPELDGLILASGQNIDDMAADGNFDGLASIDSVGGVIPSGEYEFGSSYDMGGVFSVNIQRRLTTRPYLPASLWDDKTGDIDDWPLIDETNLDGVNAALYVRTTNDNPAGTPTWGEWTEFANAIVKARGFQFKVLATSADTSQNIIIDQLGASLELQQRTEQSSPLTSPASAYSVTFANAFYQAPSIGINAYNMATGDYFTVGSVTASGCSITFRDSAGAAVARQFTYTAVGFGKAG